MSATAYYVIHAKNVGGEHLRVPFVFVLFEENEGNEGNVHSAQISSLPLS